MPFAAAPKSLDQISRFSVINERLATTSMCVAIAAGARHDPPGGGGTAHVLEHLLMSAPSRGPSFCERVERLGGYANAETGLDLMVCYAQVHHEDADEVAERLLAAVSVPQIDQSLLDAEREVVRQELAAADADPGESVQDAVLARLFAGHPLGRPVGGSPAQIDLLDVPGVLRHHQHLLRTRPLSAIVVGPDVPAAFAGAIALRPPTVPVSGSTDVDLPRADHWPLPALDRTPPVWPDEFGWICFGARSPARGAPGRHAYTLLAYLLGGTASSLMYRRLRNERGLAYAFQSWDRAYDECGAWRLLIGVDRGNGPAVVDVVQECLDELADRGPDRDDLDAARRQARMRLIVDADNPLEHVRLIAYRTHAGTVDWSVAEEIADLDAVTSEQIRQAAAAVRDGLVAVVRPAA